MEFKKDNIESNYKIHKKSGGILHLFIAKDANSDDGFGFANVKISPQQLKELGEFFIKAAEEHLK